MPVTCLALFSGSLGSQRSLIVYIGMSVWDEITCELEVKMSVMLINSSMGLCNLIFPRTQDY